MKQEAPTEEKKAPTQDASLLGAAEEVTRRAKETHTDDITDDCQ